MENGKVFIEYYGIKTMSFEKSIYGIRPITANEY